MGSIRRLLLSIAFKWLMGNAFKIECNGCLGDALEGRTGTRTRTTDYRNERSCSEIER